MPGRRPPYQLTAKRATTSGTVKFILIEKVKFHLFVTFPEKTWLQIPFGIVPTLVLTQHHMDTFKRIHDFHPAIVDSEVELLVSPTHRSGTGKLIVLDQAREIPEKHEPVREENIGFVSIAIEDDQIVAGNLYLRNGKSIVDIGNMGAA